MSLPFLIGLLGGLVVLAWAAYPIEKIKNPRKSIKNWLFGVGWLIMLLYAILWYVSWWPIFFVLLEIFVIISNILMMLNTNDRFDTIFLSISGFMLVIRSLYLFEGYSTIVFIIGLAWLGLGYAWKMGSLRRNIALTLGASLVTLFSYLEASRVFFWLNMFFAIFSLYYTIKFLHSKKN